MVTINISFVWKEGTNMFNLCSTLDPCNYDLLPDRRWQFASFGWKELLVVLEFFLIGFNVCSEMILLLNFLFQG